MNDQNLIWEAYENSKNPWDNNFRLREGVKLSGLSTSQLSEYFDNLDVILNDESSGKEDYGVSMSNDPQEYEDIRYAEDKDIDGYLKDRFNFNLNELKSLPEVVKGRADYDEYFGKIDLGVWVESVIKNVYTIVEYGLNIREVDGDDKGYDSRDYDYNPYDR